MALAVADARCAEVLQEICSFTRPVLARELTQAADLLAVLNALLEQQRMCVVVVLRV